MIDAALYVMGAVFERTRNARIMQAVRSANGDAAALAVVRQALEPRFGAYGRDEDREQFYRGLRRMIVHSDGSRSLLTRDDLGSAIVVFVLVAATALPPAVPFVLIADPVVAVRVSNVVLVALLFVVGLLLGALDRWQRLAHRHGADAVRRAVGRHRHRFRRLRRGGPSAGRARCRALRAGLSAASR